MFFGNKNKNSVQDGDTWIIIGLGNPGPEYDETRHNCGFMTVDVLAERMGIDVCKKKFKGMYGEGRYMINGRLRRIVLLKPYTYMNNSGESLQEAMSWYKVGEDRIIVIYDDTDIELGAIRVRPRGSAGSHNGMKSVLQYTASADFARVRVGIGRRPSCMDMVKFVLGHFSDEDMEVMRAAFDRAAAAAVCIIGNGAEKAMNLYNGRK